MTPEEQKAKDDREEQAWRIAQEKREQQLAKQIKQITKVDQLLSAGSGQDEVLRVERRDLWATVLNARIRSGGESFGIVVENAELRAAEYADRALAAFDKRFCTNLLTAEDDQDAGKD